MFEKDITIQSNRTKVEIIALLNQHVEPWEKDNSKFEFEGKVLPSGEFSFSPVPIMRGYKKYYSVITINGNVIVVENSSVINIKLALKPYYKAGLYIFPFVLVVISALIYLQIIPIPIPWFAPLIGLVIVIVANCYAIKTEIKKIEKKLWFLNI